MTDRELCATQIARVLGTKPADAALLAGLLSGGEADDLLTAARTPQPAVAVAAIVYAAEARRDRRRAARRAEGHVALLKSSRLNLSDEPASQRPAYGLREVPTPAGIPAEQ